MSLIRKLLLALPALVLATPALAAPAAAAATGDMTLTTLLVLLTIPGAALYFAGAGANAANSLLNSLLTVAVTVLTWVILGHSLVFSGDTSGFIGDTGMAWLDGSQLSGALIPMLVAVLAAVLLVGAVGDRLSQKGLVITLILWTCLVYAPVAHWMTTAGFLAKEGVMDFAGGLSLNVVVGFSALGAAFVLGGGAATAARDIGAAVIGLTFVGLGWFGLVLGHGVAANTVIMITVIITVLSMIGFMLVDQVKDGAITTGGAVTGIVCGLVATLPTAGFVTLQTAMIVGLVVGIICNLGARMLKQRGIGDTAGVITCHGIAGVVGILMLGLVGDAGGAAGMLNGGDDTLFISSLTGAVAVAVYSTVATFIVLKIVKAIK
ncbi:MAG: ammonium transporter [Bdellovibrionales bacterium]